MLNDRVLRDGQDVIPSPEHVEVPLGQISSKSGHNGPLVGDRRIWHRLGDGVHARSTRSTFQDDNVTILEDLTLCTLNGQEILRGEDGEGEKSETNKRGDGSHREV